MRLEINKLERENRALKGELELCGQRALQKEPGAGGEGGDGESRNLADDGKEPVDPPVPLGNNNSTGSTLAPKEQKGNAMTVRRYPIASPVWPKSSQARPCTGDPRSLSKGLLDTQGGARPAAGPTAAPLTYVQGNGAEEGPTNGFSKGNASKRKLFREQVYKCRGKVKAVSFLLPMDTSPHAENPGSLKCPQNQNTKQLTTIIEKDM
ncbi:putative coiled-coil domain-containing protein 195 [Nothoprocta perdicaria]|uniref:putative coiled-coil domain-containing protein 195 n=1 Tax=Nothoprocta perdicaria TaxID=30464 RepID=UPI000E1B7798|nr:putative coiled-coil domain-containing protein 195 [Nothoprocta perdicaria]